jgi:nucleotide-binding universal stress UspA family protein
MTARGTARFGRVVVGVDGSASAADALVLADRLVDPDGLLILACVDAHRSFRRGHAHGRPHAGAVLADARADVGGGVAVTCLERAAASVPRGLTEIAEQERADVVVIGSHRAGPEGRVTPGPTARRLLQGSPCAVAVAPAVETPDRDRFRHVGVAYDGTPEADAALAGAYTIAGRDRAAVSLFFCIVPVGGAYGGLPAPEVDRATQAQRLHAQELLDAAADEAPDGVNPRTVLLRGVAAREITHAADGIVDVLFTGSRGYGPLHRTVAGSVAESLLVTASQPVVVTPRSGVDAVEQQRDPRPSTTGTAP